MKITDTKTFTASSPTNHRQTLMDLSLAAGGSVSPHTAEAKVSATELTPPKGSLPETVIVVTPLGSSVTRVSSPCTTTMLNSAKQIPDLVLSEPSQLLKTADKSHGDAQDRDIKADNSEAALEADDHITEERYVNSTKGTDHPDVLTETTMIIGDAAFKDTADAKISNTDTTEELFKVDVQELAFTGVLRASLEEERIESGDAQHKNEGEVGDINLSKKEEERSPINDDKGFGKDEDTVVGTERQDNDITPAELPQSLPPHMRPTSKVPNNQHPGSQEGIVGYNDPMKEACANSCSAIGQHLHHVPLVATFQQLDISHSDLR